MKRIIQNKKTIIKIASVTLVAIFSLMASFAGTISWFSTENKMDYVEGGAVASYFKSGSGTQNDPYIIASRNHVYNLAWLQYIGYFNGGDANFGPLTQPYFELENDIDMEELTIPPIGTEKYPFLGHFDGKGYKISNFTISNDDPESSDSDFGVAKPANLFAGEVSDVVGFFGVVGELPNQGITYDSSIVSVSNVKLDDFEVKSKTSSTLIGLAAGYIDGNMSGVKVGKSTLNLNGQTATSITDRLSDYGLVGYTTRKGNTGSIYRQHISRKYDINDAESGGEDWGGSVDIRQYNVWMYNRFIHMDGDLEIFNYKKSTVGTELTSSYNLKYRSASEISSKYNNTNQYTYYSNPEDFNDNPYGLTVRNRTLNYIEYQFSDGAYVPLKFAEKENWQTVSDNNTGYIGGYSYSYFSPVFNSNYYGMIANSVSNENVKNSGAIPNKTVTYDNNKLEIMTYSTSRDEWVLISDKYNANNSTTNSALYDSSAGRLRYNKLSATDSVANGGLGFQKYADSRETIKETFSHPRIHSMHFQTQNVSSSSLVQVPSAKILGNTYANYQIPSGSIDFNLKTDGYINFFAGTYNSIVKSWMTFFSLYKVNRTGSSINSVQRITKIYDNTEFSSDNTKPRYVYDLVNENSSTTSSEGTKGSLVFDVSNSLEADIQCNTTSSLNNVLFYFEIPVNKGEYAMGMVPDKNSSTYAGASMIYLDIGTNGNEGDRDELTAYAVTTYSNGIPFPLGVDFATSDLVSTEGGETLGIIISSGSNGEINFGIDGSSVTYTSTVATQYAYSTKSVVSASPPSAAPPSATNGVRMIYIEARTNSHNWIIHLREVLDGSGNVSSSSYPTISEDGVSKETANIPSIVTSNMTSVKGWLLAETVAILERVSGNKEFDAVPTYSGSDNKTVDISLSLVGISIRAKNKLAGFTVSINGVAMNQDPQIYS